MRGIEQDVIDTDTLLRRIEDLKRQVSQKRSLSKQALETIDGWYDQELAWSSNALEGNALSRLESAIVINDGIAIGGKRLHDHLEAIDHFGAIKMSARLHQNVDRSWSPTWLGFMR